MAQRPLTVVQMLPALQSGGVERGTLEVARYLVEQGHRSIVISAPGALVERLQREGSEHLPWDIGAKRLRTLLLIPKLRAWLQEVQPDILHLRSRLPGWIGYMAWRAMPASRRPRLVTSVHGLHKVNRYSAVMTYGERVIAVSNTIQNYLTRNYPRLDRRRIRVIHRGVDRAEYPHGWQPDAGWREQFLDEFPQLRERILMTLPGRISRGKGHEDFVRIMAALRAHQVDVHGLVVGGAHPRRERFLHNLQRQVAAAGLTQHITFTGQRADMREILASSSVVLALSRHPEAFGRTTLEALSLGVPVVGYDIGGTAEILRTLLPRGLCAPENVAAAAQRVAEFVAQRPEVPAQHPFTLALMLAQTLAVYRELSDSDAFAE